jgi:hypothetical protein
MRGEFRTEDCKRAEEEEQDGLGLVGTMMPASPEFDGITELSEFTELREGLWNLPPFYPSAIPLIP